jgi:hypothetical protein
MGPLEIILTVLTAAGGAALREIPLTSPADPLQQPLLHGRCCLCR